MNPGLQTFSKAWEQYSRDFIPLQATHKKTPSRFYNPQFNFIMDASPVVTFVFNHMEEGYEYLSENTTYILGYSPIEFFKGGLAFRLNIIDTSHKKAVNDFIIPKLFEHISLFSKLGQLDQTHISFCYKIRKKDGTIIWVLETMRVIEVDEDGRPLLSLFQLIDITHLKKDDKIEFCINKCEKNGTRVPIYNYSYSLLKESGALLSEREKEVLRFIGKGLSSKCIAAELEISFHTVSTHRKNMLKKMGCKNSSELVVLSKSLEEL